MREQVQKTGVRKWAGQDLVDLQHEPLVAITAFFEEYGSCIIRGCDVIPTGSTYSVTPGMVALEGTDQNGQPTFKVAPFAGVDGVTLPVYLTLTYSIIERPYADLKVKPIAYDFRAAATGVKPTDKPYLEVGVAGGKSFVDAIQDAKHRFLTDTERSKLTGIEANANNYVHPAKHPASMIEQDDQNRMVSASKMIEWDAKATTAYVLNKIAELVGSSPAALDTLNELATALGNDPNFATTITNALAGKAPSSHKHNADSVEGLEIVNVNGARKLFRADNLDFSHWIESKWILDKGWRLSSLNNYGNNQPGIHRVLVDEADSVTNGVYTTDDVMVSRNSVSTNSGDWNDLVKAGIYQVVGDGTWNGSTNSPSGAYMYGLLCVFASNGTLTQLYFTHVNSQLWVRSKFTNGSWFGWRHIVDSEALSSYATIEHVRQKIAEMVGSSPAALDTLNELAAALGNDPNFATTVMNALAGKAPASHTHNGIESSGRAPILTGKIRNPIGFRLHEVYNDGYPALYGNVIKFQTLLFGGELYIDCKGGGGKTPNGDIWLRIIADWESSEWSDWVKVFHSGNFNPNDKADTNHNHDDKYQPKGSYQPAGSYLTQQQLEACFPSGTINPDGSKKEHFFDVICAGMVDSSGSIKDYWGENRVYSYPFAVDKIGNGRYRITHNANIAYYGVLITARVLGNTEYDNYGTWDDRQLNSFVVNMFNDPGSFQDMGFNFVMYRLR